MSGPATKRFIGCAIACACLVGAAVGERAARAEGADQDADTEVARRHFDKAVESYQQGDYQSALKEFKAANRVKPRPAFDFNIGRCDDRMEQYPDAIAAFERFVAAAPNDPDAGEARARILVLKARLLHDAAESAPAPTASTTAATAAPSASREKEPAPAAAATTTSATEAGTASTAKAAPPPPAIVAPAAARPGDDTAGSSRKKAAVAAVVIVGGAVVVSAVAVSLGLVFSPHAMPPDSDYGDHAVGFTP